MYGWMGKIIRIDLSAGSVDYEPLSEELCHDFVGGRGINSRMLYDERIATLPPFHLTMSSSSAPVPFRALLLPPHRAAR